MGRRILLAILTLFATARGRSGASRRADRRPGDRGRWSPAAGDSDHGDRNDAAAPSPTPAGGISITDVPAGSQMVLARSIGSLRRRPTRSTSSTGKRSR